MKYIANPVVVTAHKIVSNERLCLQLDNGEDFYPTVEMLARITPQIGDYVVTQEDGYQYLNPKDVFERKYSEVKPIGPYGNPMPA
jgi:hypothetical protein